MEPISPDPPAQSQGEIRLRRSNYSNLIQVASSLGVVAFHLGIPGSQAVRVTVGLFFVTAGMHMATALKQEPSVADYTWSRARRLLPEVSVIWLITLIIIAFGMGTDGMRWFAGSAPFFLQNLTPSFFDYHLPRDAVFGALWFVGALLQLQVILYASRRFWEKTQPTTLLAVVFGLGFVLRFSFVLLSGNPIRMLSVPDAGSLYCMPFCHIEAIMLGILLGRGALPNLGRRLPFLLIAVIAAGAANLWLSEGQMASDTLGYEFPLRANGSHLWGYPLLALAAASLCARDGFLAQVMDGGKCPAWLGGLLSKIAPLTYGIYVFHGFLIATGINGASRLSGLPPSAYLASLFVITFIEAALLSMAFKWAKRRIFPSPVDSRTVVISRNPLEAGSSSLP